AKIKKILLYVMVGLFFVCISVVNYYMLYSKTMAGIEKTAEQAKELRAEEIVVGYPKNMNGTVGERAEKCQLFAQELEKLTGCPVKLWDERCTTVSAHGYLNVTNTRGKKRKAVVDAVAAVLILESYLGYRKNSGLSAT
ncbi:MAG: Holliday junction resolvase RuvX, partial [Ruminococcus sp.]|nr:Holliday junction resolvase RuvX [Ruminococcus sp.]